ncbi:hypothetical protein ABZX39_33290 [Streptomyces collinus]|uniref:hypothetical protein n=1 Tax=Streptomyces collinus TaxID=42684 RepID=UPI0033A83ED3
MGETYRPRLASAVSKLKQYGDHDEAAAVAALLGPRGYLLLKRTETGETEPLSITVPEILKQAINQTADEFDLVLDGLAEEAYRKVLEEGWVPPAVTRLGRGQAGTKSTLQVQVDSGLRARVQGVLADLSKAHGYRVTEGSIVLTHVCEELGIERPNTAASDELYTKVPRALRDFWKAEADRQGLELRAIVEDGIHALLDGEWSPERHPYFTAGSREPREGKGTWSEADRANVKVQVEKQLLADLRAHLEALSERLGYLVGPGMVLRAILTDRLGEPQA